MKFFSLFGATTTLTADITTQDGAVTINDAVILAADIIIDTTNSGAGTGANITIATGSGGGGGTIETDGTPWTLEFIAGSTGDLSITGAVGATNEVDKFLITSAGNVYLNSVRTGDSGAAGQDTIDITASGTILLNGDLRTDADTGTNDSGNVVINGDVVLGANISVLTTGTSSDGDVSFSNSIDADDDTTADRTLTVNADTGTATFGGNIGALAGGALADLDVTAGTINLNGGTIKVDDDDAAQATVTFTGPVVLGANTTIDTDKATGTDSNVNFTTLIDSDDQVTFDRTLTISAGTGTVTLGGNIGDTGDLAGLNITAGTININGSNYDLDDGAGGSPRVFDGAVVLGNNVNIDANDINDNNINFTSTINADDATTNDRPLTLDSGTATITVSGNIGNTQALAGLILTQSGGADFQGITTVTDGTGVVTLTDSDNTISFSGCDLGA